jgi:RNA polymerase sigma-70 factor (ECF subfamily)
VVGLHHRRPAATYPYLPAVRADLLRRLGCDGEAATAFRAALDLTRNEAERAFTEQQLASLP